MKLNPIGANKTELHLSNGTIVLFSYKTPVAAFAPDTAGGWLRTEKRYSNTTSKHITQWLDSQGVPSGRVTIVPQEHIDALAR